MQHVFRMTPEHPLDWNDIPVLLALARNQKVDLLTLSITKLAEQYLAFVHEARRRNFALAAARAMMDTDKSAEEVARTAMAIAADICVYTNGNLTVETLG